MAKIPKTYVWASLAACLAMAFAATGVAFAQEQSEQNQASQDQQQSSDQDQPQQQSQQDEQSQQEQPQQAEQQRQQADEQREQAQRQREQAEQQRERGRQSRESWRDEGQWPSPRRYEADSDARQWRSDSERGARLSRDGAFDRRGEFSRDAERSEFSSSGQQQRQGGLGVHITTDDRDGVVVLHVHSGSPAEEMGIRNGDRITQVNGQQVESTQQFISMIRNMDPGEEIELDIRRARGGGEQTVRGELESRAEALADRSEGGQYRESGERYSYSDEGMRFGRESGRYAQRQDEPNWQTSYEEERSTIDGQRRGQVSSARIEQLQRQVDRLSQQVDDLRMALRDLRRQGGQPGQTQRERTARYEEYEPRAAESPRRSATRWDDSNRFRQSDRTRATGRSGEFRSGQRTQRSGQFEDTDQPRARSSGQSYESRRIDPD
jgi:hypothetical protein